MADVQTAEEKRKAALESFGGKTPEPPAKTQEELDAEKKQADDAAAIEAKKKEDEEAEKKRKEEEVKTTPELELTDEQFLQAYEKKTGRKAASLEELKPTPSDEDRQREAAEKENNKLSFGLKKGLFNTAQYEDFIADRKDPESLVYSRELAEAKKEDPDWDEEKEKEFREDFETRFGLNLDSSNIKYKRGQSQLKTLAENILRTDYSGVYKLDSEFEKFESEQASKKAFQQKIIAGAPIYKKDVEDVLSNLKTVEVDFEGEKVAIALPEGALEEVSSVFSENEFAVGHIKDGYTKEGLTQTAESFIKTKYFNALVYEAAKKYREKHEKGVRGIPEGGRVKEIKENEGLTDKQQQALEFYKGVTPTTAN